MLFDQRLAVVLGFITLGSAIATFLSCRSCLSFLGKLGVKHVMENKTYKKFYQFHGYYWSAFLLALSAHLIAAFIHTGLPARGDPDAGMHWIILSFGFSAFIFTGTVLTSCRSMVSFIKNIFTRNPLNNGGFGSFYHFHSLYWWALIALVAGHFTAAYLHIGFWPH